MSASQTSSGLSPARTTSDGASAYASLSKLVHADRPLADTLERVSVLAAQALSEASQVSLTLIEGERAWTVATLRASLKRWSMMQPRPDSSLAGAGCSTARVVT